MSVYTRVGDKGKTSLYGGKPVSKADIRVEAYGNLDELNSFLGVVLQGLKDKTVKKEIITIQNDLFEIGSCVSSLSIKKHKELGEYLRKRVLEFEKEIDSLTKKLPELENFILPGGSLTGSKLHFARTITRRAERRMVALSAKDKVLDEILVYLNRLSDLLFMYARYINYKEKKKELLWFTRS